jgi:molybdopterin biosynthesis enzyme
MVTSLLFVAPYLRAWRGEPKTRRRYLNVRLRGSVVRGGNLLHFVPCRLGVASDGTITAKVLRMNGSGDFVSASRANGFLQVPGDGRRREAGSIMTAVPIQGIASIGEKL